MSKRSSRKRRKQRQRSARPTAGASREAPDEPSVAPPESDAPDEPPVAPAESDAPDEPLIAPRGEEPEATMARGYARGRAKDEAARAALRPLSPGERPRAVTVAGVIALAFGLLNLGAYLAGEQIGGERPQPIGVALFTLVMFVAAYGCFRVRYWAVLGVQVLLGLLIVVFSVLVIGASNIVTLLICLAVILPSGALFWFLVKSMARIQMPERPGSR